LITAQQAADQRAREVGQAQSTAQAQKFQIAFGDMLQPGVLLVLALLLQALGDVHPRHKPGGVEHRQVVGVDGGLVAMAQGIAGQKNREGAAVLQLVGALDHLRKRHVPAPEVVDGLQAGGAAGRLVRLRQHPDRQTQRDGVHGTVLA
jgi:hypothetical protein